MRKIIFDPFDAFASWISDNLGHPLAFIFALTSIFIWGILGPFVGYSDSWMLWVNTGTTIITFLMLFVLQNSQNRSSKQMMNEISELKDMISQLTNKED